MFSSVPSFHACRFGLPHPSGPVSGASAPGTGSAVESRPFQARRNKERALVAVAPLLVSSFAFNFNNFNAIQLLTQGGPFAEGEYTRGGTDILISMIYRIAFNGSSADYGFAL